MDAPRPVLLFKDPAADSNYESTLQSKGYLTKCIPVLHTIHTNIADLVERLLKAKQLRIRGMLVTSKRSCESLGEALTQLCSVSSDSVAETLGW